MGGLAPLGAMKRSEQAEQASRTAKVMAQAAEDWDKQPPVLDGYLPKARHAKRLAREQAARLTPEAMEVWRLIAFGTPAEQIARWGEPCSTRERSDAAERITRIAALMPKEAEGEGEQITQTLVVVKQESA